MRGMHETRTGGSLTVELVVLAPVVVLLGLLGLGLGRYELVRGQVLDAAHAGALAASVAPGAAQAGDASEAAAVRALGSDAHACPDPVVSTATGDYRQGGSVTVAVTCVVPVGDLTFLVPGRLTMTASSSVPIDEFRSVG